jgi:NTP pyrophosphatase (non-canonical NTP hydrolase)
MADDKTKRAPQDAILISLEEDYEVAFWTRKYGVTKQRLADAVAAVGDSAERVGEYLKGRRRPE